MSVPYCFSSGINQLEVGRQGADKMITEIVTFQLKGEATLPDPSSPARKVIRDFLTLVLAALGARSAYYGQFIEKPEIVIMFIGWDSIDDHKSFMNSPYVELSSCCFLRKGSFELALEVFERRLSSSCFIPTLEFHYSLACLFVIPTHVSAKVAVVLLVMILY